MSSLSSQPSPPSPPSDPAAHVAAGVAHLLRHSLSGIASAAQLLRYRVREDPVIEMNVGRILREVERLNHTATALLEYSRPDPPRLHAADPDEIWRGVHETQRGLLESKALVLRHTRVPPQSHVRCNVDAEQISQVFVNLLTNAVEAAPEGSDLTLESSLRPDGAWQCRLHNPGPPIPPDALPRVFELLFTTRPGANGIGLALCRRILAEHHGTIDIESGPGATDGTRVTVVLPTA